MLNLFGLRSVYLLDKMERLNVCIRRIIKHFEFWVMLWIGNCKNANCSRHPNIGHLNVYFTVCKSMRSNHYEISDAKSLIVFSLDCMHSSSLLKSKLSKIFRKCLFNFHVLKIGTFLNRLVLDRYAFPPNHFVCYVRQKKKTKYWR